MNKKSDERKRIKGGHGVLTGIFLGSEFRFIGRMSRRCADSCVYVTFSVFFWTIFIVKIIMENFAESYWK